VNPLVPYRSDPALAPRGATRAASRNSSPPERERASPHEFGKRIPQLVDGGLPVVMSQTFRSLIHSRLELGMKAYAHSHPDTEVLLIEPDSRDAELFLANTFSYAQRRHLAEHAFQATRHQLLQQAAELAPRLAQHGLRLREDRLHDSRRSLIPGALRAPSRAALALARLDQTLAVLEARTLAPGD